MNTLAAKTLPPGTQLQLIYVEERLRPSRPGHFIEIGPGNGDITHLLLQMGWTGRSVDLDTLTVQRLQPRFANEIASGVYEVALGDFVATPSAGETGLVISCMVMEHLPHEAESAFMMRAAEWLSPQGLMIGLVPASPAHWGNEDDIAGHCRRYTRATIAELGLRTGWRIENISGLTYRLSNMVLPLSNYLVRKNEASKLRLPELETTKHSGRRSVRFKTHLPSLTGWLVNRYSLLPAYLLQKLFRHSDKALVLYFEARPLNRNKNNA